MLMKQVSLVKYVFYSTFISVLNIVGIYYDMPPRYILSEKGKNAAIYNAERGSGRLTAVLTIAADGLLYHSLLLCFS